MGKTRVGVILREGIAGSKSSNQSADLKALTDKYFSFTKKLRSLLQSLQQHHASLLQIEKTRSTVALNFADLSKGTPLWEAAGQMPGGDRPADSVCSYASIHSTLSAKTKSYATKYQQFVIDYVVEWEKTVTTRVETGLKKAEEQRRELDHYQKKVEALRLTTNKAMAQGKSVKPENAEKLKRNEEKLVNAKQTYNKVTSALCILMEEVSERSWRDLHPLLIKCAQFDMTIAGDESRILSSCNQVVNKLKEVATANGISPQPRLKDLGSLNPELLSTRPGGLSGLAIEASSSLSPTSSASATSPTGLFDPMALPPGSVGAQGMGGYPVPVANAMVVANEPTRGPSRASSFSSFASSGGPPSGTFEPPSTLNMLTISQSSAPAPTMEDVYSSTHPSSVRSAPSSGNFPPLPSPVYGGTSNNHRSSSFSDLDSYTPLGAMAPPPAAAPPPPPPGNFGMAPAPMSAPPPPLPMYNAPVISSSGSGSFGGGDAYGGGWAADPSTYHHNPYAAQPAGIKPASTNPFDI